MASTACEQQLNAQLQIMDTRLKAAEKNIGVLVKAITKIAESNSPAMTAYGLVPNDFTLALTAMGIGEGGNTLAAGWNEFIKLVPSVDSEAIQGAAITAAVMALGAVGQYTAPFEAAASQIADTVIALEADVQAALNEIPPDYATAEALGRQISDYQTALDGLSGAMTALDNIAKCKSASLMVS